jgi:hypothetical protein
VVGHSKVLTVSRTPEVETDPLTMPHLGADNAHQDRRASEIRDPRRERRKWRQPQVACNMPRSITAEREFVLADYEAF